MLLVNARDVRVTIEKKISSQLEEIHLQIRLENLPRASSFKVVKIYRYI